MMRNLNRWFNHRDVSTWVFTCFIIAFVCIGRFVDDHSHGGLERSILYALAFGFAAWIVSSLIFHWFDRISSSKMENEKDVYSVSLGQRLVNVDYWMRRRAPITFTAGVKQYGCAWLVCVLLCWLPWLVVCWPGVMRDDTIAQFMQSAGYHRYYSQHPLFDTLIFGLFWNIGSAVHNLLLGMGLYIFVQALAFAAGVALVLCYLRKLGSPRSLLVAVFLFFAFCPAIVGAVPTMAKDSLHAVFLLPLSIVFIETCRTRGVVLSRWPVAVTMVTLIILCALSKRTATLAIICAFLVLVVISKGYRTRVISCLVVAIVLAQGVIEPGLEKVTHARITPGKEVMGLVMLPVARMQAENPEYLTSQERDALSEVMNVEEAGETYAGYRVDETSWTINNEASAQQKVRAIGAWISLGLRAPAEYIKAYGNLMLGWFYPQEGVFYGYDSDGLFNQQYMKQWDTFVASPLTAEDVLHDMRGTGNKPAIIQKAAVFGYQIASDPRLNAHAYYATYIPLLLLVYGVSRRRWLAVAAGSMLSFNVLVLYLSPLVFSWYLLPVAFILPLFFGVTACFDESEHWSQR